MFKSYQWLLLEALMTIILIRLSFSIQLIAKENVYFVNCICINTFEHVNLHPTTNYVFGFYTDIYSTRYFEKDVVN